MSNPQWIRASQEDYEKLAEQYSLAVKALAAAAAALADERKHADALAMAVADVQDTIGMHGLPQSEDVGAFMLVNRVEWQQLNARLTEAFNAARRAAEKGAADA